MEQIKLEIQKLYKALDKLETRCDKIKNLKVYSSVAQYIHEVV